MESFLLPQIKAHHHYSLPFASIPIPKSTRPSSSSSTVLIRSTQTPLVALAPHSFKLSENGRFCNSLVVECSKGGGQLVESHQSEDLQEEEEEEWAGIEEEWKWGNCQGAKGIVELMECLEREAIMGEDQGTHPSDYNRRAQIFDKSSTVFQAFKDNQP